MAINFTLSGNSFQISHEELESRLIALRNAKKSTYVIKADLTVTKFNTITRIVWICLHFFRGLRNYLFRTDLSQTREILNQLRPQVTDSDRLNSLYSETMEIVSSKPDKTSSGFKVLRRASQGFHSGFNWRYTSRRYVKMLNQRSSPLVKFNPEKVSWFTNGGNCTAIALDVINHYIDSYKEDSTKSIETRLKRLVKKYRFGGNILEMRARQGAFNCIELKNKTLTDPIIQKVSSLAQFHHLTAPECSPTFDLLKDLKIKFTLITDNLTNGVYFLRVIKPSDNEKKEVKGHSMVFIRANEGDYFFDPNKGLEKIESDTHQRLFEHLKHNHKRFGVSQATFVRIEK